VLSQINGCAYCNDMHWKDARAAGETAGSGSMARIAWRESPYYKHRSGAVAALEWTESLIAYPSTHAPDEAFAH